MVDADGQPVHHIPDITAAIRGRQNLLFDMFMKTPDGHAWIYSNLACGGIIPSYGNLDLILAGFYRMRSFCREL